MRQPQRFAAWRSGGFLAQKFNRRTALEPTTKLSYEALQPPLRQTAVTSSAFLSVEGMNVILWVGYASSFASLGHCVAFWGLQMCLHKALAVQTELAVLEIPLHQLLHFCLVVTFHI